MSASGLEVTAVGGSRRMGRKSVFPKTAVMTRSDGQFEKWQEEFVRSKKISSFMSAEVPLSFFERLCSAQANSP